MEAVRFFILVICWCWHNAWHSCGTGRGSADPPGWPCSADMGDAEMTQIRLWSGFSVSSRQMDAGMVHKAGKQTHKLLLCRWHTSLPSWSSRPGKA